MDLSKLTAISPVDGRYRNQADILASYFSEFALIKYRLFVEMEYFISLCELPLPQLSSFDKSLIPALRKIHQEFSLQDAQEIKDIEKTTNHDVKAVEYFIKKHFDLLKLDSFKEFVHFGLTSQDINNTSIPLSLKDCAEKTLLPLIQNVVDVLDTLSETWKNVPMLAKTHGQPASPTRLGKEIAVFSERLKQQLQLLSQIPFSAKFGGATGNMNAHYITFPDHDWHDFAKNFVSNYLGLTRSFPTTQIEHYDNLAAWFDTIKRINTILIDFSRDVWQYVSMNYFKQKIKKGEIGSSAMPHKVNPIDFENAEGNLGVANALFEHFSAKLPISRLQRDLTDSTVLRNIGVPIGHTLIALNSLLKGVGKLELNEAALEKDLNSNWAVVAEAIQNILRREAYPNPYEALLDLTRKNKIIEKEDILEFIENLKINDELKLELRKITPSNYLGK
ncbi:MAG: adenylosuccinate lyase [Cyclobacteriaceae bacterium]|nr:adenylosuccinate lyase [Cyclobacteriaceae bacterium]